MELAEQFTPEAVENPHNLSLLFALARNAARESIVREDERMSDPNRRESKAWGTYNSSLEEYNKEYDRVSEGQKIEERLDEIIAQKGSAVCIVAGTDDNPLAEYMRSKNQDVKKLTVITLGLKERRSQVEIDEAEAQGHYAISTTIGTPECFEKIHALLNRLSADEKIREAAADVVITRLFGGWSSIPFRENIPHLINVTNILIRSNVQDKYQLIRQIMDIDRLDFLPEEEHEKLFQTYERWLMRSFYGLLTESNATILGEIPFMIYDNRLTKVLPPNTLYTSRVPGVSVLRAYANPEETQYNFRLDLN